MSIYRKQLMLVLILSGLVGCDSSTSSGNSGGGSMDQMAARLEVQNAAEQKEQQRLAAEKKAEEERQAAAAANQPPARSVAGRPGVGQGGYYTAIVGARRHILNQVDSWAWKQAVQHFRATEGRKPKDHEEFMKKIIIPLEIDLGYIEENQEFLYDPNAVPEDGSDVGVLYVVEKAEAEPPQAGDAPADASTSGEPAANCRSNPYNRYG